MLRFPLTELLNEQECYDFLLNLLHPEGLCCPNGHQLPPNQAPHARRRAPILKYRCRLCGKVFHLFTKTILSGIYYNCRQNCLVITRVLPRTHQPSSSERNVSRLLDSAQMETQDSRFGFKVSTH